MDATNVQLQNWVVESIEKSCGLWKSACALIGQDQLDNMSDQYNADPNGFAHYAQRSPDKNAVKAAELLLEYKWYVAKVEAYR